MVCRVWQPPRQRYSEEDWFSRGKLQETLVALAECRVFVRSHAIGEEHHAALKHEHLWDGTVARGKRPPPAGCSRRTLRRSSFPPYIRDELW